MKKFGIIKIYSSGIKSVEPFTSEDLEQITNLCELMNETRELTRTIYNVFEIK